MNTLPIANVPLKEMDSSLLTLSLLSSAKTLGIEHEVSSAVSFAAYFHLGQTRMARGNLPRTPYIEHPLRNTIRLIRWGWNDRDTLIASIFHDVPEDCAGEVAELARFYDTSFEEEDDTEVALSWIGNTFGARVAQIDRAVTNPPMLPNLSLEKKFSVYRLHIRENVLDDDGALLVKASDLCDNAGSLHHHIGIAKPESLVRRARKYLPVLGDVYAALEASSLPRAVVRRAMSGIAAAIEVCQQIIDNNGL